MNMFGVLVNMELQKLAAETEWTKITKRMRKALDPNDVSRDKRFNDRQQAANSNIDLREASIIADRREYDAAAKKSYDDARYRADKRYNDKKMLVPVATNNGNIEFRMPPNE